MFSLTKSEVMVIKDHKTKFNLHGKTIQRLLVILNAEKKNTNADSFIMVARFTWNEKELMSLST